MSGHGDGDSWLSSWEQHCIDSIDEQPNYEQLLITDTDTSHRKIWIAFQDSATSIAQLYRDRSTNNDPAALWIPFQAAAGTVTTLYKESCENVRRISELGIQCGYQKRNKDLVSWAKKRRTYIRREDLLAYLSGKPPPPRAASNHHRASPRPRNISPPPDMIPPPSLPTEANLHAFQDALALSPLSRTRHRGSDLCAFITTEIARHCKRSASPSDVTMSSPTHHKRPKYM